MKRTSQSFASPCIVAHGIIMKMPRRRAAALPRQRGSAGHVSSCFPTQAPQQAGFDDLPAAVHLSIVLSLPLVQRVRSGLVSRRWAALLKEPSFWAELDFHGAPGPGLTSLVANGCELLVQLCHRSGWQLCALDLSEIFRSFKADEEDPESAFPLLERLAEEKLADKLQVLQTRTAVEDGRRGQVMLYCADNAARLRAACPALRSATVSFRGGWQGVTAAMRTLSCEGRSSVSIAAHLSRNRRRRPAPAVLEAELSGEFLAFATSLTEALRCCSVHSLTLESVHDDSSKMQRGCATFLNYFGADAMFARAGDPAAAAAAAEELAAVLACPEHGPRRLKFHATPQGWGVEDAPSSGFSKLLWGAMSPQSPLTALSVEQHSGRTGYGAGRDALDELAAALDPCRRAPRQLEQVELWGLNLMDTRSGKSRLLTKRRCSRHATASILAFDHPVCTIFGCFATR